MFQKLFRQDRHTGVVIP